MAVEGAGKTAEVGETVNSDTELTDFAAVSVEGRVRQTDRDVAELDWTSMLVRAASTVPDCSSSEY